jgi:hypothetical protein
MSIPLIDDVISSLLHTQAADFICPSVYDNQKLLLITFMEFEQESRYAMITTGKRSLVTLPDPYSLSER